VALIPRLFTMVPNRTRCFRSLALPSIVLSRLRPFFLSVQVSMHLSIRRTSVSPSEYLLIELAWPRSHRNLIKLRAPRLLASGTRHLTSLPELGEAALHKMSGSLLLILLLGNLGVSLLHR